jgi:hypothetical protein
VSGRDVCGALLKKNRNLNLTGSGYIFFGTFGKERNRRIFQRTSSVVDEVAQVITNDTKLYQDARNPTTSIAYGGLA